MLVMCKLLNNYFKVRIVPQTKVSAFILQHLDKHVKWNEVVFVFIKPKMPNYICLSCSIFSSVCKSAAERQQRVAAVEGEYSVILLISSHVCLVHYALDLFLLVKESSGLTQEEWTVSSAGVFYVIFWGIVFIQNAHCSL